MNKNRTYLYIAIFVLLLVAAYYLTTDRGEKTSSYDIDQEKLFEVDSAQIDKIEIVKPDGRIVLVKSGGEWRLSEPVDARAFITYVESALSNLEKMKLESIVSSNPEKFSNFGFDPANAVTVSVYEMGQLKGTFILGNQGPSANQSYVKKTDGNNIYLADNLMRMNFVKQSIDDWRDKVIVKIPTESVQSVEFVRGGESFKAVKDTTGRFMIGADSVSSTFNSVLTNLQNLNTQSFKDTTLSPETKFDERMIINWGPTTELNFLKADSVNYMLQVSGDKQIYLMQESLVKNIIKPKNELIAK